MKNLATSSRYSTHFSLFQSHLDLAHNYWTRIIELGDTVIDATCGNGQDALVLAKLALNANKGHLHCFDIQTAALENTTILLKEKLDPEAFFRITLHQQCHSKLSSVIPKADMPKLVVYNLGYRPGGEKSQTTTTESTLQSIMDAQGLIAPGGVISITCYPGHEEGKREEDALLKYASTLSPRCWSSCHHQWLNRQQSPSLLLLQKISI